MQRLARLVVAPLKRPNMTKVYFRCSDPKEVLVDRCGAVVDDLAKGRDGDATDRTWVRTQALFGSPCR
jgi:hypothetical protein